MPAPTNSAATLMEAAERYAEQLELPGPPPENEPWAPQSLTKGAAGIALLHIERAHVGTGTWRQAHRWIVNAVAGQVSATDATGLYLGAPAVTLMLDAAAAGATGRYRDALADVDVHVAAHRRVEAAMARISAGELPGVSGHEKSCRHRHPMLRRVQHDRVGGDRASLKNRTTNRPGHGVDVLGLVHARSTGS